MEQRKQPFVFTDNVSSDRHAVVAFVEIAAEPQPARLLVVLSVPFAEQRKTERCEEVVATTAASK